MGTLMRSLADHLDCYAYLLSTQPGALTRLAGVAGRRKRIILSHLGDMRRDAAGHMITRASMGWAHDAQQADGNLRLLPSSTRGNGLCLWFRSVVPAWCSS